MKRASKHVKESLKPARQPAYKTPAQELGEFKAKVLAMKWGKLIWLALDARAVHESGDHPGPFIEIPKFTPQLTLANWQRMAVGIPPALTPGEEFLRDFSGKFDELWPEYELLLKRNPDELKAYRERYGRLPKNVVPEARGSLRQARGAPRTKAARDAQIVQMKDAQELTFGKIARKLKIPRERVSSAYYRMKPKTANRV